MSFFGPSNVQTRSKNGIDLPSGTPSTVKKKKKRRENADGASRTPRNAPTTTNTPRTINPARENAELAQRRQQQLQNDEVPASIDNQQAYIEYRRRYFEKLGVEDGKYTDEELRKKKITPPKTYDEWSRATRGQRRASLGRATRGKKTLMEIRGVRTRALWEEARQYWNRNLNQFQEGDDQDEIQATFKQWYKGMKAWLDENPTIKEAGIEASSWETTFDAYVNRNTAPSENNNNSPDEFVNDDDDRNTATSENSNDSPDEFVNDDDDYGPTQQQDQVGNDNVQNLPLPNYTPVPLRNDDSGNMIERAMIDVNGTKKRPIRVSELLNSGGLSSKILQWLFCDNVRRLYRAGGNDKRPRAFFSDNILRDMTEAWKWTFIPYYNSFEIIDQYGNSRYPSLINLMNIEEDTYQYRSRSAYGWTDKQMIQVLLDDRREIVNLRQDDEKYLKQPNAPGKNLIHSAMLVRDNGELHLLKGRPIVGAVDAVSDDYVIINKINFGNQIFDSDADGRDTYKLPFKHVVEAIFMMKLYGKQKALITSTYDDRFWLSALQVMLTSNLQQDDRVYGPWFNIEKDSMRSILDRPLKALKSILKRQYLDKYGYDEIKKLGRPSDTNSKRFKYNRDLANLIQMYDAFLIKNFGENEIEGWNDRNRLARILSPNIMNAFENAFTVSRLQRFIENYNREVALGWANEQVDDFNVIGVPQIPLTWAEKGIKNLFTKRYTDIRGGTIVEATTRISQEELFTVEWDHGSTQTYNRRQLIKLQRQAASFIVNKIGFRNVNELRVGNQTLAEALKTGRAISIDNIKQNFDPVRHEVCMEVDLTGEFDEDDSNFDHAWGFLDRWIGNIEATGLTEEDVEEQISCLRIKNANGDEEENLITRSENMRQSLEQFMNDKVRLREGSRRWQLPINWWRRIPNEDREEDNRNNMMMQSSSTTTTRTSGTSTMRYKKSVFNLKF